MQTGVSTGNRGFSTLEIVLAMAIIALAVSGVAMVLFGGQDATIHSRQYAEALSMTKHTMAQETILAQQDFNLIYATSSMQDGYTVTVASELQSDFLTKKVTVTTGWNDTYHNRHSVSLSTLFTNYANADGGDTCNATLIGDWMHPVVKDMATVNGNISDIVVYKGRVFVTIADHMGSNATLYVFDTNGSLLGKLDVNSANAIAITDTYAYIASNTSHQLEVVDISNLNNMKVTKVQFNSDDSGRSVFYANGIVYLGLKSSSTTPELQVIDVHDPLNPKIVGNYAVGDSINSITGQGGYLYITTDNQSNPLTMFRVDAVYAITPIDTLTSSSLGYGEAAYTIGHTLYFGRTYAGTKSEFVMFDTSSRGLDIIGQYKLNQSSYDVIVRGSTLFTLASSSPQLRLLTISDPTHISDYASSTVVGSGVAMDCEGNTIYVASNKDNVGHITAITGQSL